MKREEDAVEIGELGFSERAAWHRLRASLWPEILRFLSASRASL